MRNAFLSGALGLSILSAPAFLFGQDQLLSIAITSHVAKTLHLAPTEGSKLSTFRSPTVVRSLPIVDENSIKPLLLLWSAPKVADDNLLVTTDGTVSSAILAYFSDKSDFQLGFVVLDDAEKTRLNVALQVLFEDPANRDNPTRRFQRYREWQDKRKALLERIDAAQTTAQKTTLNQQLALLDQDYALVGEKEQVEAALQVVTKSSTEAPLFLDQLARVKEVAAPKNDSTLCSRFLGRVTSRSAWVRIASDVTAAKLPEQLKVRLLGAAGQGTNHDLRLKSVSYQAVLIPVEQPSLTADIIGNRAWRRKDGAVISHGGSVSTESLLPFHISHVLVLRDIDLEVDSSQKGYAGFAQAISSSVSGSVGGMPLELRGPGAAYLLPEHVFMPAPIALAGVVAVTPKIPNAAPDLDWK